MKKILALVMALCMVLALCACGQQQSGTEATGSPTAADASAESAGSSGSYNIWVCDKWISNLMSWRSENIL